MSGSDNDGDRACVSIDAISDPIAGYVREDETAVIETMNEPFEDVFGDQAAGQPVRAVLQEQARVTSGGLDALVCPEAHEPAVEVQLTGTGAVEDRRRLRRLDDAAVENGNDGYILLEPNSDGARLETDSIASIISHDLRNPLDVAKAHLRAARETGEVEHFDEIERSHDRIERIIGDVLTLARGARAIEVTEAVDIGRIANDAWSTVDTGPATHAVDDDLPRVAADPDRLKRLFENLYRNSIEHGADDAQTVQVTVGSLEDGFYVVDNGRGIPVDERDRVFEPGYSASGAEGGTGLGLTIVEQIADAHDWRLELTAGSEGGARFEFRWNASDDDTAT